ncbi:PqiC family protein [Sulfurisoma sediminicola]|uniref:ABC-type transport auxiliary lipoprotein component domain-containing protein n=1 Tax=Sulfurisoma sediminicola TaxID=1381557 RepID=A0A497XER8_9PROT|nr:PqiC family protein [Sulfurisoma sediminicola]RLJ65204.1 hypothetical protein DFR35_1860 [Sulfurisoma sediminicola]
MNARLAAIATFAALAALLGGCSSAPATRFYTLDPVVASPSAGPQESAARVAKPLTIVVTDVRLPQYLDRPQIVTRGSDQRLRFAEYEHWGGNLRDEMIRILAENLGRLLPGDRVIAAPHPVPLQPDYRLALEVQRFERDADGRVQLIARWWLTRSADLAPLASPAASFAGSAIGDSSIDALVQSMSAVYGELAQAIARSLPPREAAGQ